MEAEKKDEKILNHIASLPNELLDYIFSYIPIQITYFLTKESYIRNHNLIRKYIVKDSIEVYIRCMVRQDNQFVLKQLLHENYKKWINMKNYYYKNCIFVNYIYFLESYAADNESVKTRRVIKEFLEEQGLSKNQHKKNIVKYIRWKA